MTGAVGQIVPAAAVRAEPWAQMRSALWPDGSLDEHRDDIARMLLCVDEAVAFIALDEREEAVAFIEAALRHDYVNGCDTSPVLFVEGLFVMPDARRSGIAHALIDAVSMWGQDRGCTEMASDADIANLSSHAFHHAAGFIETERVVYFHKMIG